MCADNLREYFSFQRRQRIKRSLFKTVHNRAIMGTRATFLPTDQISLIAQNFLIDSSEIHWEQWWRFSFPDASHEEEEKKTKNLLYELTHFSLNDLCCYSHSFYCSHTVFQHLSHLCLFWFILWFPNKKRSLFQCDTHPLCHSDKCPFCVKSLRTLRSKQSRPRSGEVKVIKPDKCMLREDHPAALQISRRETPKIKAVEATILLVEWARTAIGEG